MIKRRPTLAHPDMKLPFTSLFSNTKLRYVCVFKYIYKSCYILYRVRHYLAIKSLPLKLLWHPKQRHHFANKGLYSQSYGFSSSHVCESWTIKEVEHQGIDAFELWCQRRFLKSLGQQADQTSQSLRKSTLNILWKD